MSEPEDLILDGAHFATRVVRDVWRRYAPERSVPGVLLTGVRTRLELFVAALFGASIPIVAFEPAAPATWLSRLAGGGARAEDAASCGTDGQRVFLPAVLDAAGSREDALALYRLLAVQQSARLTRRTHSVLGAIASARTRDWFRVAEAAAVDRWIASRAPGLVPALIRARADALARRKLLRSSSAAHGAIEHEVRRLLSADPSVPTVDLSEAATPEECLAWATAGSQRFAADRSEDALRPVFYWGTTLAPLQVSATPWYGDHAVPPRRPPPRVSEMRRRPKRRTAEEDDQDRGAGIWVIRADEPQESVEDPLGLQRPADRQEDADADGLADSLSELPEASVVRTPQPAREVLRSGEPPPRAADTSPPALDAEGPSIAYPEWDMRIAAYRQPGAVVRQPRPSPGGDAWVSATLVRQASLVRRVRTRFERLRPRPVRIFRQIDGDEVDLSAFVAAAGDRRAGLAMDDRVYVATRAARRELAVAVLLDVSASTDAWVSAHRRIVDLEKEAMLVVGEALEALGDRYGLFAFSGEGAEGVEVTTVKDFGERATSVVQRRIGALDADRYTRLGAPLRHVTAALCRERAAARLLLLLSDGKPNDVDVYEGPYGVEDTRQAVAEARRQGVTVFCVTVDRHAPRYARRIFGHTGFAVLHKPEQLPTVVVEVLRHLVRA